MEFYNNSQYRGSIENKKTLVLDSETLGTTTTFTKPLTEPLKIDAVTDVYLDSFTTFKCKTSDDNTEAGFLLNINEFNSNVATNNSLFSNTIFIPNEQSTASDPSITKTHKGKKLNYVGYLLPQNIHRLTGTITALDGSTTMGVSGFRFIAEFVLITRE